MGFLFAKIDPSYFFKYFKKLLSHPKSSIGLRIVFQSNENFGKWWQVKGSLKFKTRAYNHCAMGEKTTKLIE